MLTSAETPCPSARIGSAPRASIFVACALIVLFAVIAYSNTFSVPFLFDDKPAIEGNPTIRQLWPLRLALTPPTGGLTVSGRPLLNFSFAINFAISGTEVWSYHALNIMIHALAGLTLFGLVRRTLNSPMLRERFAVDTTPFAFSVALLWTLHPIQTESVTYIAQRAESLMGLFFLFTFYSLARTIETPGAAAWRVIAFLACLAGMAVKEVMVVAPVLLVLYDRTFFSGSFREAWQKRGRLFLTFSATWIPLAWLVMDAGSRGGTFILGRFAAWWSYWLTQFVAVTHYLKLAVWPQPLVFAFEKFFVESPISIVPQIVVICALVASTIVAVRRWPIPGFLGCWFFALLAPSSLMPGNVQMIVEHRMYLALIAPIVFSAWLIQCISPKCHRISCIALAMSLGLLTWLRNLDYSSPIRIWSDSVVKQPSNAHARLNLADALLDAAKPAEATAQAIAASKLQPKSQEAGTRLSLALSQASAYSGPIAQAAAAVRISPNDPEAQTEFGIILAKAGRLTEALEHAAKAVQLRPDDPGLRTNYGFVLAELSRWPEAIQQFEESIRLQKDPTKLASLRNNLGNAFFKSGRMEEAIHQYRYVLKLEPGATDTHFYLGLALGLTGSTTEAVEEFKSTLTLAPNHKGAIRALSALRASK